MNILVSGCLLGLCCRYDGKSKPCEAILALMEHHHLIPACPESLGGLPIPRPPAERQGERVVTKDGADVTVQYRRGAQEALYLAQLFHCEAALLKERSPSCGKDVIHDGSFTGGLQEGSGITAELLMQYGIPVYGESEWEKLMEEKE